MWCGCVYLFPPEQAGMHARTHPTHPKLNKNKTTNKTGYYLFFFSIALVQTVQRAWQKKVTAVRNEEG